jgi:seryl-tRNA synthetase
MPGWRQVRDLDSMRAHRNSSSIAVSRCKDPSEREKLVGEMKTLKTKINALEVHESTIRFRHACLAVCADMFRFIGELDAALLEEGLRVPNLSHPDVPVGPESAARTVNTVRFMRTQFFLVVVLLTCGIDSSSKKRPHSHLLHDRIWNFWTGWTVSTLKLQPPPPVKNSTISNACALGFLTPSSSFICSSHS